MGSNGVMLLIIIICIILSGYFSATETAFSAINRVRIRNQAEKGNKRAALVLQLSDNYDSLLSTILIGNNIVNIGCSSLATILFVKLLGEEMGAGISTLAGHSGGHLYSQLLRRLRREDHLSPGV